MAAQTAATTTRESVGSLTLMVYTFTSVTTPDTFASGLGANVVSYWAHCTSDSGTQGYAGVNCVNSSGTFTFYPGENATAITLFVLSRT
jgi:hypothetical protein